MKYVAITGGVVSGLGKGITSSSIGVLLKACGLNVTSIKIDPYLNTDAGTMSPYEHGECYVLDDGGECDLDMGNYERFLGPRIVLTRDHNITTGKIYAHVISKERKGDFLGKTVQVVPHITDAIQDWVERVARVVVDGKREADVCLIELGGTVGDIESMIFLEALRQLMYRVGNDNFCLVHVSLVPSVGLGAEQKSKPTQHGVRELRAAGLNPDLIVCRSAKPLERSSNEKISHYSMLPADNIISVHDVSNIYRVPLILLEQRVPSLVMARLKINKMPPKDIPVWRSLANRLDSPERKVTVAVVGKYTGLTDSYLSLSHALRHAAMEINVRMQILWIDSEHLETTKAPSTADAKSKQEPVMPHSATDPKGKEEQADAKGKEEQQLVNNNACLAWEKVRGADGILVPGGFGERGIEGMILAVNYARKSKKPFLGVCLGMQVAIIEWCRDVLGLTDAHSTEFDKHTANPVVIEMPEIDQVNMGGTMRLGARRTNIKPSTIAAQLYANVSPNPKPFVYERHRHRFEVNPKYVDAIGGSGMVFSGVAEKINADDKSVRMEIAELPSTTHPFFFGVQYHPEFKSRPLQPSPPFQGFVQAAAGNQNQTPPTNTHPPAIASTK